MSAVQSQVDYGIPEPASYPDRDANVFQRERFRSM